ncbi:MAG: putative secreted protein [Rhodospirillales bacterium]|nr:putative secreted protein [Rhodospirillales bacterium]
MSDKKRRMTKGATGCSVLALALVGALALPSAPAAAQSATPAAPTYYKNKGPGGNNSYAFRYEEDFSFLRDPSKSTDFFDPVKFIAFDDAKQVYVTFSALERLRYENNQNNTFGLGPQTKGHQTEAYSRRTQVGADVHLGPNFRIYAELLNAAISGRNLNGGQRLTTSWRNDLALQQAFLEAMANVDVFGTPGKVGIRAGRQGIYLGNGLAFSFPATSNIVTIPDGIRAYLDTGHDRLDLFAGMPSIRRNDDLLRDGDNTHQNFYVAYGSHDFPTIKLMGADAHISDDPFLIFNRGAAGPATGTTRRTLTTTYGNGATAINTITGQEEVYTIGDRLYGDVGNFDFDWTGQLQRGSFGGYSVEAFAVYTDWGYTLRSLPWRPRFGTHADVASGGGDKASKTTNLFDNQFIRQPYIGETVNVAPSLTNLYDVSPRVRIQPLSTLSAEFSWTFWWRYSSADAVYGPQGGPFGTSQFAATLGKPGSYIGSQPQLDVRWTPIPHVALDGEIGQMVAGPVIKNAGGQNDTYAFVQVTLQF